MYRLMQAQITLKNEDMSILQEVQPEQWKTASSLPTLQPRSQLQDI